VGVVVLDLFGGQSLDIAGPIGQIVVTIMAACAEIEAKAIAERTRSRAQWAKAQGLAYIGNAWGRQIVVRDPQNNVKPRDKCIDGVDRKCLEWDVDFLHRMAEFVHRLRKGEKVADLIEEFRANYRDGRGKPFLACYDRDGKMHSPWHRESKNRARKWVKTFVRLLHQGELPAPFGTPGIINPVNRGLARNNLRWIDRPDFTIPVKRKARAQKRDDLDRSTWTVEDWNRWWRDMHTDLVPDEEKALDVESLKAEIKMKVEALKLNGNGSHAG